MDTENRQLINWRRIFIAILVVLLVPLLVIAMYNHAIADDYVWAYYPHQALVESGGSPIAFLGGCWEMISWNYINQHGEYTAALLGVLNPLSWDDSWCYLGTWALLAFLIFSVFCCWRLVAGRSKQERVLADITACVSCIILIELVPRAIDMFYWYDGAVNYLPFYGMQLILLGMLARLYQHGRLSVPMLVVTCIVAFLNIGGNYVTVAVNLTALIGWAVGAAILRRKDAERAAGSHRQFWGSYLTIMAVTIIGLLISVLAPGNSVRMGNENDDLMTSGLVFVSRTIDYAAAFVKNQLNITMILLLALLVPIFWRWSLIILERAGSEGRHTVFELPAIPIVCYMFLLHCAAYAPTIWIYGNEGAMRMEDVRFFYLVFWLVLLEFYFIGKGVLFLQSRGMMQPAGNETGAVGGQVLTRFLAADLAMIVIFGVAYYVLPEANRETLTSMSAAISLLKGEAQEYDQEVKAQQEILEDPATEGQDVEVVAVTSHPRLLYNSGLEMNPDPENWINQAVAEYYNKASVTLIKEE